MNREHIFKFGRLEFLDSYAVITCNEGVNIDFDEIHEIEAVILPAYSGRRFGLIANRVNSYSVNPFAINKLFSDEHLVAGAIVSHSMVARINAELENKVVKAAPIKLFDNMAVAIKWIKEIQEKL